jgi:hypothetical protein
MTTMASKHAARNAVLPVGIPEVRQATAEQLKRIGTVLGDKLAGLRDKYDERLQEYMKAWEVETEALVKRVTAAEKAISELSKVHADLQKQYDALKTKQHARLTSAVVEEQRQAFNSPTEGSGRTPVRGGSKKASMGVKKPAEVTMPSRQRDTIVKALVEAGLEVKDNRLSGGALWVMGAPAAVRPVLSQLKNQGVSFTYSAGGSKATGNQPGWFTKAKG